MNTFCIPEGNTKGLSNGVITSVNNIDIKAET